jgi:transposase
VLRQEHRAGEKMFVDYAGATIPIYDPRTGAAQPAAVFAAVLGASSYTFAEATPGQDLRSWIIPKRHPALLHWGSISLPFP